MSVCLLDYLTLTKSKNKSHFPVMVTEMYPPIVGVLWAIGPVVHMDHPLVQRPKESVIKYGRIHQPLNKNLMEP